MARIISIDWLLFLLFVPVKKSVKSFRLKTFMGKIILYVANMIFFLLNNWQNVMYFYLDDYKG